MNQDQFWALVDNSGGRRACWLWTGARKPNGYGNVSWRNEDGIRVYTTAHRYAYEHLVGPVPEGLEIDHLCYVTHCCNPAHMEVVTHAENIRRRRPTRPTKGSISRYAEGRWRVWIELPRGEDGRRRRKTLIVTGTEKDARNVASQLLDEHWDAA